MTELEKRKIALEVLKEEAKKVGIQLTPQDEANIIANGISSLEQLKGLNFGSFGLSEPIHYGYGRAFYGQDEGPEIGKSKIRK